MTDRDILPTIWSVHRWADPSGLQPDYTVQPDHPERPTPRSPHRPLGTLVRRLEPRYVGRDEEGWLKYEAGIDTRARAQALADALNGKGAARERTLRERER